MARPIRKGIDNSAGHCYVPTPPIPGETTVFFCNGPATAIGDPYPEHCCPGVGCHPMGVAVGGSSTVFIGGMGVHRAGDAISCGDVAANGCTTVDVGD